MLETDAIDRLSDAEEQTLATNWAETELRQCIQCGSCSGVCPFGYLMDFPPSRMISALRSDIFENVKTSEGIWMCIACSACTTVCPTLIPVTVELMAKAKEELLLTENIPAELQTALEYSQRYGNPLGESPRKRADWIEGIEPKIKVLGKDTKETDILWYVGDYGSYHSRVQLVSKAFARILHALGIDFAILGRDEYSDGDSQRLAGEKGLFEMLAEKNAKSFGKYQFNEIITTDPHAYNAFKNEYPKLGINYPVRHYTQYLVEKLDQIQSLLKKEVNTTVTFHDPCYLGRVNNIYEEPRTLLDAIPGVTLVEMPHNKSTSLCCGGGGGGMWLDGFQWEVAHTRLSEWRVQEAMRSGADILAIACPYEAPRFEDATKTIKGAENLIVKDISELLADSMEE